MLEESKSKISNRFLYCNAQFSSKAIQFWKSETRIRCAKKEKNEAYHEYLNWQESKLEKALFTMYAYADLKIPKKFSCVFNYGNPNEYSETSMILTQSIWEGWLPVKYIDHGYKHLTIFRFESEIPELIGKLHLEEQKFSTIPKNSLTIGICQLEEYDLIKRNLILQKELRNKYGPDWYEHYIEIEK